MMTWVIPLSFLEPTMMPTGGQRYFELGSPLLSHASSQRPVGCKPESSHTHNRVGSPKESEPAGHLDRVWPDTDPA